jgi:hypothetical protein
MGEFLSSCSPSTIAVKDPGCAFGRLQNTRGERALVLTVTGLGRLQNHGRCLFFCLVFGLQSTITLAVVVVE